MDDLERRIAYATGFIDATLGSVNNYTAEELRVKMAFVSSVLKGEPDVEAYKLGMEQPITVRPQ